MAGLTAEPDVQEALPLLVATPLLETQHRPFNSVCIPVGVGTGLVSPLKRVLDASTTMPCLCCCTPSCSCILHTTLGYTIMGPIPMPSQADMTFFALSPEIDPVTGKHNATGLCLSLSRCRAQGAGWKRGFATLPPVGECVWHVPGSV